MNNDSKGARNWNLICPTSEDSAAATGEISRNPYFGETIDREWAILSIPSETHNRFRETPATIELERRVFWAEQI